MKQIDLNKSIYELWKQDPDIVDIMVDLGFHDITKKGSLNTVGRVMTLSKGALMKGMEMDLIIQAFMEKGYSVI